MSSEHRTSKNFPTILSKLKAVKEISGSGDSKDENAKGGDGSKNEKGDNGGCKSRNGGNFDPRATPRLAWMARKDSTFSNSSSQNLGGHETPKSMSFVGRIPSLMSLGGTSTAWGKRLKKKRDAEEYAAQKLARRKEEMIAFYRGTPMTDDRATSTEILRFLYELWQPQLCPSYRKDARITTSCRQDLRTTRKLVQTTPKRIAKLHRARLVIETISSLDSRRPSTSLARPKSAKSVT